MENQFAEKAIKLWRKIGTHGIMTLATCANDRVSSRSMSVIIYDEKFYCQTDETFLKYKQIIRNPNAALCYNNYSIEGKCRIIGHPLDENNNFFAERFKKYFINSFEAYTSLQTEKLIEITPVLIYTWEYKHEKPYKEYYDFNNRLYHIEMILEV